MLALGWRWVSDSSGGVSWSLSHERWQHGVGDGLTDWGFVYSNQGVSLVLAEGGCKELSWKEKLLIYWSFYIPTLKSIFSTDYLKLAYRGTRSEGQSSLHSMVGTLVVVLGQSVWYFKKFRVYMSSLLLFTLAGIHTYVLCVCGKNISSLHFLTVSLNTKPVCYTVK